VSAEREPRAESRRDGVDRAEEWRARAAQLKDRLARARTRYEAVSRRLHVYERALPQPDVLRQLLPARAASRARAADPAAAGREAAWLALSEGYRDEIARDDPPVAGADHVTIAGLRWWVPPDSRMPGRIAERMLNTGWLPLKEILQAREVSCGGVMLDVGANIGTTSITRAVLGDAVAVYAAEPEPANFACLVRNIAANHVRGVVLADRVAIGDRIGRAALQRQGSIGAHTIVDAPGAGALDVPVITLDAWVERARIDVEALRFVKVDTQGREGDVLGGAASLLARDYIAWQLEFSPAHLRTAGCEPAELLARLRTAFTHFIDLKADAPGERVRRTVELSDALAYLDRSYTNLLLYRSG
jgi:FkbM family methyltransferase